MTPGTYLRKRREASALTLLDVAVGLARLAPQPTRITPDEIQQLLVRVRDAEADRSPLIGFAADLLARVVRLNPAVYLALFDLHHADPATRRALPEPQVYRTCACSWHDPCSTGPGGARGPCAWSTDPSLCTACEPAAAAPARQMENV